ncbi:hypothetical protein LG299_06315 [Microbacterium lacus]|uniref:PepSY domain-containing protein n=1 Tax=Microbacterium lacus TaxID=415217 RepID=UPI00384AAC89
MRKPIIWITSVTGAAVLIAGGTAVAVAASNTPSLAPISTSSSVEPSPASVEASDLEGAIAAALAAVGPGVVLDADVDDNAAYAYEIDVRLDAGGVVEVKLDSDLNVVSTEDDDLSDDDFSDDGGTDDDTVTDAAIVERASAAALAHVGSGTVVSVENSDDSDHIYEVEIDLGNGEDIDVELDGDFAVVKAD